MCFLWLKNKTRSRVKAGISYTSERFCLLQLTLIPGLSCLPLPLRKFNLLPCHCYNNLQLLDTSLSMTVSQNLCHTHLRQAVFRWYIFIPHSCRADFQSPFPSAAAQGQAAQGRRAGSGAPSSFGFSRPNYFFLPPPFFFFPRLFLFLPEQKSLLVMVVTASFCALTLAMFQTQHLFQVCPYSSFSPLWKIPVPLLFQFTQGFESFLLSVSASSQFCIFLFIDFDSSKQASILQSILFNKMVLMHFSVPFPMHGLSFLNYPQGLGFFPSLLSFCHEGLCY